MSSQSEKYMEARLTLINQGSRSEMGKHSIGRERKPGSAGKSLGGPRSKNHSTTAVEGLNAKKNTEGLEL